MDIDPQAIVAALAAGKNAIDSTLSLLRSDVTLEKSELKLRLAGAVEELAKAKVALTDAGDAIRERDDEILRLRNALSARSGPSAPNMVKGGDAYFDFSVASGWSGDPCCMRCWERDREKVHLATAPQSRMQRVCPRCGFVVNWRAIRDIRGRGPHKPSPPPAR